LCVLYVSVVLMVSTDTYIYAAIAHYTRKVISYKTGKYTIGTIK